MFSSCYELWLYTDREEVNKAASTNDMYILIWKKIDLQLLLSSTKLMWIFNQSIWKVCKDVNKVEHVWLIMAKSVKYSRW